MISAIDMRTHSGRTFVLNEPDPAAVDFADIALSLSRINRFLGHTGSPYTVAEHCIRVSYVLEQDDKPSAIAAERFLTRRELALRGLLHDAAEAFLGDITAPVKRLIREQTHALDVAEAKIERAILTAAGLRHMRSDPPLPLDICEMIASHIKWADMVMLRTEQRDHMGMDVSGLLPEPLPKKLAHPLTAEAAERAFLDRLEELTS